MSALLQFATFLNSLKIMPKVGKKHYAYTKEGVAAAKKAARKKGVPVKNTGPKMSLSSGY